MELMQAAARALYPNVVPGPTAEDSWFQEERVRDLVWRQNEEVHRALQEPFKEFGKRMRSFGSRMPC